MILDEDLDILVELPIDAPGPPVIPPPLVDGQAAGSTDGPDKADHDGSLEWPNTFRGSLCL